MVKNIIQILLVVLVIALIVSGFFWHTDSPYGADADGEGAVGYGQEY